MRSPGASTTAAAWRQRPTVAPRATRLRTRPARSADAAPPPVPREPLRERRAQARLQQIVAVVRRKIDAAPGRAPPRDPPRPRLHARAIVHLRRIALISD